MNEKRTGGPDISPDFTIEDIHKIREYDYEQTKGMTAEEANAYFKVGADRTMAGIERIRKEKVEVSDDVPNAETVAAMEEVEQIKADPDSYKSCKSFLEAMEDMEQEEEEAHIDHQQREPVKTFHYRGLEGSAEVSIEDGCLYGVILGIDGAYAYEGNTLKELEEDFHNLVDLYISDQAERESRKKGAHDNG